MAPCRHLRKYEHEHAAPTDVLTLQELMKLTVEPCFFGIMFLVRINWSIADSHPLYSFKKYYTQIHKFMCNLAIYECYTMMSPSLFPRVCNSIQVYYYTIWGYKRSVRTEMHHFFNIWWLNWLSLLNNPLPRVVLWHGQLRINLKLYLFDLLWICCTTCCRQWRSQKSTLGGPE